MPWYYFTKFSWQFCLRCKAAKQGMLTEARSQEAENNTPGKSRRRKISAEAMGDNQAWACKSHGKL